MTFPIKRTLQLEKFKAIFLEVQNMFMAKSSNSKNSKRMYKIRKKREAALHAAFVKILMRSPVKGIRFFGGDKKISLTFFGERFSYRILVKREIHVGGWNKGKEGEIRIDKDLFSKQKKSFRALCVHEAIEKFVAEKYGLKVDDEAHVVATKKEEQYLKSIGGNWRSHQILVYHLWDRLNGH